MTPRWQRWWSARLVPLATSLDGEVDLIRASLAPYGIASAILEVARRLRRPLVLDLEDPWALDEMMVYPTRVHRRLELRRMRRVLTAADAVVMNTSEAARRAIEAFPELATRIVRGVPNAFDPADFDGAPPERRDGRFRIVHTGSMHTDLGLRHRGRSWLGTTLGGHVEGVDFLPRSHIFLVEALHALLERHPELADTIELHFAGVLTERERAMLTALPYARLHGFLPHRETVALIRSADLLFLPMHDLPPGRRATIVPQKTYEYVASGRPILAAVPDGDARDLLVAAGTARLCRPADTRAMSRILGAEIDRWSAGGETPSPPSDVLASCAAPRLVADVAGIFEELLTGRIR
jgi:glycosyltransferase involved in cell wall biosynthesis